MSQIYPHHISPADLAVRALDTQQLREQVTNGVLGEIYVTTARALRRCGVPGWGVFTNKELQGGGPLIDIGIHMLDAAM